MHYVEEINQIVQIVGDYETEQQINFIFYNATTNMEQQRIKIPMDHYNCAMVINRRFNKDNDIETVSPAKPGRRVSKLMRAVSLHIKAACFSEFLAVIYSSEVSELGCKLVKFDQIEGKW